ncbi:MAG TPA: SpoIIE family protein phosphatase [Rhodanobacteraceae bacterium]|nr:SpoIIE family protein phosphatase [Rhodanobacteraceae bacterium]
MPDLRPPTTQEQARAHEGSAAALPQTVDGQSRDGVGERVLHLGTDEPARILVVDDNEANRDLLIRRLQRQGHHTATAENGRIALDMLAHGSFDLILLDIMMPEMNGFEVLEHLKADDALRHVPVIMISALDDAESVSKGIALGADDHLPKPFDRQILNARVTASLAKKRLHDREQLYARSLEREMDIAREIQAGFLPRRLPVRDGWDLAAWFEPARRVAGDFYDAFEIAGGRLAVVLADVCDKGVGAALFMALFRSLVRALGERLLTPDGDPGSEACRLIGDVNNYIARTHERANMFATMFFGSLDLASGELVYVNAGHEPPLITGPQGVRARLAPTGPAVGMLADMDFQAAKVVLGNGEALVAFTDGVTDSHNADGALFGDARLRELVTAPAVSAQAMVQRIQSAVQAHAGDVPAFDDVTLLVVQRTT